MNVPIAPVRRDGATLSESVASSSRRWRRQFGHPDGLWVVWKGWSTRFSGQILWKKSNHRVQF